MQQNILDPLGMKETRTEQPYGEEIDADLARGYRFSRGQFLPERFAYCPLAPAAAITTTADDMTRFMRAHLNQGQFAGVHILQPPTVDLMHSDLHRNHPQATPLAHGFIVQEQSSIRSIEHRGSMPGFLANLCLYPTQKMGIFVAQNTRTNRIANHITDAFFERYVAPIGQGRFVVGAQKKGPCPIPQFLDSMPI